MASVDGVLKLLIEIAAIFTFHPKEVTTDHSAFGFNREAQISMLSMKKNYVSSIRGHVYFLKYILRSPHICRKKSVPIAIAIT